MIRNIKYKLIALLFVLTASSCNKWLDLKPQDGLVRDEFWKTKEQLQSAVIGCYTGLLNPTLVRNMFIWGELRADMVTTHGSNSFPLAYEVTFNDFEILSTNPLVNWSSLYTVINYCNTVIEFGPEVKSNDNTLTEGQLNAYIAEARALRAWMYFYLVRTWGEVPLQLRASSSDSKIEQLPKSTKEDIYAQILGDLDYAAIHAPETYGRNDYNKGRVTKFMVYALQADVYLWRGEYEKSIAACDKIIGSNRFGLINDPSDWYNTLYVQGNSNESIFEIQFHNQAQNSWYAWLAAPNLSFKATDIVPELFGVNPDPLSTDKDIRGENGSYRADGLIWKHVGTSNPATTITATTSDRHWIVYRYADILLMKAEALINTGQPNGVMAKALIKQVRDRATALAVTSQDPGDTDYEAISDYLLEERAREFAFEGKRWYDLLRFYERTKRIDVILEPVAKVAALDKQQSILAKLRDPRSHYLPIALSELQADKLLVQNSFYK